MFSFILLLTALIGAEAQTKAASCSQNDVNNAINSASSGDTVTVPAGNCSWSGLSVAKAITLQGAGVGQTNISLNGTTTFTKQSAGVMRITGFSFSVSGGGDANKPLMINGSWLGAQPIVFANNSFNVSGSGLFRINVPAELFLPKINSREVGTTPSSRLKMPAILRVLGLMLILWATAIPTAR